MNENKIKDAFDILFLKNKKWKLNDKPVDKYTLYLWFRQIIKENIVFDNKDSINDSINDYIDDSINDSIVEDSEDSSEDFEYKTELKLIGLHGSAESGKDTFASCKIFDDFIKLSFAQPIKDACKILFGFTEQQLYNEKYKNIIIPNLLLLGVPSSPRKILQWLGTDILRKYISDNFFIDHMTTRLQTFFKLGCNKFIITDIRFPNEAEFIIQYKGYVVHIIRPNHNNNLENSAKQHISEQILDSKYVSYKFINNKSTLSEYFNDIIEIFKDF